MKKQLRTLILASCLSLLTAIPAFAGWQQAANGQWQYEQDGAMLTGKWLQDQGSWYYLDENGMMLAGTTRNIDGTDYSFDGSGRWIEPAAASPAAREGWNTYINATTNYYLQYPATLKNVTTEDSDLALEADFYFVDSESIKVEADVSPAFVEEALRMIIVGSDTSMLQSQSQVQINGYTFTKYHYVDESGIAALDIFSHYESSNNCIYLVGAGYLFGAETSAMEVINTFTILQ